MKERRNMEKVGESMKLPKIEIKSEKGKTELRINGEKINGVREILFKHGTGEIPVVQFQMLAMDVEIDADVIPALPDVFKPFYELKEPDSD